MGQQHQIWGRQQSGGLGRGQYSIGKEGNLLHETRRGERSQETWTRKRSQEISNACEAALAKIWIMQKSIGLIIPKAAVSRLVQELTQSLPERKDAKDFQWTVHDLEAIHEGALETYGGVRIFERSNLAAIHGKRVTIMPRRDMQVVFKIREEKP
jgi:histone H3/H4